MRPIQFPPVALLLFGCTTGSIHLEPTPSDSEADTDTGIPIVDDSEDDSPDSVDSNVDTTDTNVDTTDTNDTAVPEDSDDVRFASWFNRDAVQEVRITIDPANIHALQVDPFTYVQADATLIPGDGAFPAEAFSQIGIRLKGSSSYREWTDGSKPAFKLKLNHYVVDQKWGDIERVTLNNQTGDMAMAREVIGYALWNDAGVLAPAATYARVYVNDEYYGLYVNLEAVDDHFVQRHLGSQDGDLWEGNDSADFSRNGTDHFESVLGTGDRARLEAAAQTLRGADDVYADLDAYVDMDQFLDFWAYSIVIGNKDGYPYNLNDYFVYDDLSATTAMKFSPWGMDESWDTGMSWNGVGGDLAVDCYYDERCLEELYTHMDPALAAYEAEDMPALAQHFFDLSAADMLVDPRMEYTPGQVEAQRVELMRRIEVWPGRVRRQMGM